MTPADTSARFAASILSSGIKGGRVTRSALSDSKKRRNQEPIQYLGVYLALRKARRPLLIGFGALLLRVPPFARSKAAPWPDVRRARLPNLSKWRDKP